MSYRIVQTCGACPEQYDVFDGDEQVGYLRLRHGGFRADYPDSGGKTVYSASPNGDGVFDDDEREFYLSHALEAIRRAHEGIEPEEAESVKTIMRHGFGWAVIRYGDHDDECNTNQAWGNGPHECDCGFALFTGELQASAEVQDSYKKVRKP